VTGNKAMKRAMTTSDALRINADVPLITDTTELITPEDAQEMLNRNQHNRPVNWNKVEEFAEIMRRGEWQFHPQGIILDPTGNIITGQTRLWAVVYAECSVYMRVSRGCPAEHASVIDRGRPQSARDLSTRKTERKHSPVEASMARCVAVLRGNNKPDTDCIAAVLVEKDAVLRRILKETAGGKKDKAMLMILGAIAETVTSEEEAAHRVMNARLLADKLESELLPYSAASCWGRGVSFGMALRKALVMVRP
jgi:hypothetical protein